MNTRPCSGRLLFVSEAFYFQKEFCRDTADMKHGSPQCGLPKDYSEFIKKSSVIIIIKKFIKEFIQILFIAECGFYKSKDIFEHKLKIEPIAEVIVFAS